MSLFESVPPGPLSVIASYLSSPSDALSFFSTCRAFHFLSVDPEFAPECLSPNLHFFLSKNLTLSNALHPASPLLFVSSVAVLAERVLSDPTIWKILGSEKLFPSLSQLKIVVVQDDFARKDMYGYRIFEKRDLPFVLGEPRESRVKNFEWVLTRIAEQTELRKRLQGLVFEGRRRDADAQKLFRNRPFGTMDGTLVPHVSRGFSGRYYRPFCVSWSPSQLDLAIRRFPSLRVLRCSMLKVKHRPNFEMRGTEEISKVVPRCDNSIVLEESSFGEGSDCRYEGPLRLTDVHFQVEDPSKSTGLYIGPAANSPRADPSQLVTVQQFLEMFPFLERFRIMFGSFCMTKSNEGDSKLDLFEGREEGRSFSFVELKGASLDMLKDWLERNPALTGLKTTVAFDEEQLGESLDMSFQQVTDLDVGVVSIGSWSILSKLFFNVKKLSISMLPPPFTDECEWMKDCRVELLFLGSCSTWLLVRLITKMTSLRSLAVDKFGVLFSEDQKPTGRFFFPEEARSSESNLRRLFLMEMVDQMRVRPGGGLNTRSDSRQPCMTTYSDIERGLLFCCPKLENAVIFQLFRCGFTGEPGRDLSLYGLKLPKSLKILNLDAIKVGFPFEDLVYLLNACPLLEECSVSQLVGEFSEEFEMYDATILSKLRLRVHHQPSLGLAFTKVFCLIWNASPRLTYLDVCRCFLDSSVIEEYGLEKQKSLRSLFLCGNANVTAEGLALFLMSSPSLIELDMTGIDLSTDEPRRLLDELTGSVCLKQITLGNYVYLSPMWSFGQMPDINFCGRYAPWITFSIVQSILSCVKDTLKSLTLIQVTPEPENFPCLPNLTSLSCRPLSTKSNRASDLHLEVSMIEAIERSLPRLKEFLCASEFSGIRSRMDRALNQKKGVAGRLRNRELVVYPESLKTFKLSPEYSDQEFSPRKARAISCSVM